MPGGGGLGLPWDGNRREAAAGSIAAFGPLRRDARCWRGREVSGRDGAGVAAPGHVGAGALAWSCRPGRGAGTSGLCGRAVAPRGTKPGRLREARCPAKIRPGAPAAAREEGAARSARGSRRPSTAGPVPPEGAVQIGAAGHRAPRSARPGHAAPAPEPGTANPSLPVVTFRFKSASQNVFTAPAGGPGWRRWLAKPGEVSLGRDYRTLCAGLGAGGWQCSPESWGHVGDISYSFSR